MKNILIITILVLVTSCTTIHFRSKGSIPVSFEGNPNQTKEVFIEGRRNFYFWGVDPEEHVVYVDEDVQAAGYNGISKLIIYEQKNPQDILISFLTFGLYLPRGYTITGFVSGKRTDDSLEDTAPSSKK